MGNVLQAVKGTPDGLRKLIERVVGWWAALAEWWKNRTIQRARKRLVQNGFNAATEFNVAVVGMAGVGRSTLINALCRDSSPDAARSSATGEATQMKKHVIRNATRQGKAVALWEIPGAGVVGQPARAYFEINKLHAFDCYVVVIGDRVTEVDMDVARKATALGKPCIFVRNKADIALRSLEAEAEAEAQADPVAKLREDFKKSLDDNLKQSGLDPGIYQHFVVSALLYVNENLQKSLNATQRTLLTQPVDALRSHLTSPHTPT